MNLKNKVFTSTALGLSEQYWLILTYFAQLLVIQGSA